jgi:hypothetical protein
MLTAIHHASSLGEIWMGGILWEYCIQIWRVTKRYWIVLRTEDWRTQALYLTIAGGWCAIVYVSDRFFANETLKWMFSGLKAPLAILPIFAASFFRGHRTGELIHERYQRILLHDTPEGVEVRNECALSVTQSGGRTDSCAEGHGITFPTLNSRIVNAEKFPLTIDAGWYAYAEHHGENTSRVPSLLNNRRRYVALSSSGLHSNDSKVRLSTDLEQIGANDNVRLQKTDYLSSLMTDGIAFTRINATMFGGEITNLSDGLSHFYNRKDKSLRPLSDNFCSNQIGASTLAFTTDGKLVVYYQTASNAHSGNMFVPSGSGSFNWWNRWGKAPADLLDLVNSEALRELREESGLDSRLMSPASWFRQVDCKIMPFAFTKLLHRGGKPEFFCIGKIDCSLDKIMAVRVSRSEKKFTEKLAFHGDIEFAVPRLDYAGLTGQKITEFCDKYLSEFQNRRNKGTESGGCSYQLEHGLILLKEAAADPSQATKVADFLTAGQ